MNSKSSMPSWSLLQSFAAVAEFGSLSAAAREIHVSQPTLSRHISDLEKTMGQRLFYRSASGLDLSPEGRQLFTHVATMSDAAHKLVLQTANETDSLSGTVRITASQIVATYLLPNLLYELNKLKPNVAIEVIASDKTDNLLRREADIAIRMYRPLQDDVVTKKIGELQIAMFAAHSYIAKNGIPLSIKDIENHKFIGYDRSSLIIDGFKQAGLNINRDFFVFRSDDQVVCWKMVIAGLGIGFNQLPTGNAEPRVARIKTEIPINSLPVWLTAHAELKDSARVRFVYDYLATSMAKILNASS